MDSPRLIERIPVSFRGTGSGVGELSWGQADMWYTMLRQRSWLPMGGWKRLPPGAAIADAVADVAYVMGRYQTMRTRLRFTGARPQSQQVLRDTGQTHLDVFDGDSCPPGELDGLAQRVQDLYQQTPYDFGREWPLRVGVIRHLGELTHHIAIMCHIVTDGIGAHVILRESQDRPATPVTGMQPLEQAAWQSGPAGQRQHAAAVRHWERILRSASPHRFPPGPERSERPEPRHWRGDFTSRALRLAAHALTARSDVDSAQVVMTLFAMAMARTTGINPVLVRPMVSNRFRPGHADVVAMLAQHGLCALDVGGLGFAGALDVVGRATLAALKNAYYDPARMTALIEAITAERGPDFEVGAYFNDRRMQTRPRFDGAPPEPDEVEKALPRTEFRWTIRQNDPFEKLIVHVEDLDDAFNVVIFMDTHVISPALGEGLMRAMEEIAVSSVAAMCVLGGQP